MYHKIQIKFDYGEIDIYRSWIMTLFLLEDRDFKGFWMKIWNAGVSVITRSTFSSFYYFITVGPSLLFPGYFQFMFLIRIISIILLQWVHHCCSQVISSSYCSDMFTPEDFIWSVLCETPMICWFLSEEQYCNLDNQTV